LADIVGGCAGDVRNDIYITLMHGELRRGAGGKVADKNIEVTIMVCNQDGEVIPVNIAKILMFGLAVLYCESNTMCSLW